MTRRRFAFSLVASAEPRRIISTTPGITEILFALGLGSRVVGVTKFCRYPPEAARLPKIGGFTQLDIERITSLRPDLVIIQRNPVDLGSKLRRMNLPVLELPFDSVSETLAAIDRIGAAAGASDRGRELSRRIRGDLDRIRGTRGPPRTIAFIVGRNPGAISGLMAVGRASFLRELIEIAGGRNVFDDAAGAYPKVTLEELLSRNPDVIVDMGEMAETTGDTATLTRQVSVLWAKYPMLKAVRERRLYAVASDIYVRPGPRMAEAAQAFARMLHPEER